MHLADDGVARHLAKLRGDSVGAKAVRPELLQKIDTGIVPARTIARGRAGAYAQIGIWASMLLMP